LDEVIANSFVDTYVYTSSVNAGQANFSFHLIVFCLLELDLKITEGSKHPISPLLREVTDLFFVYSV